VCEITKGGFFSESEIRFSNLPIYPELEILISFLLIWAGISNFKLRIVFWNDFFGRLEYLKNESHFLKKSRL